MSEADALNDWSDECELWDWRDEGVSRRAVRAQPTKKQPRATKKRNCVQPGVKVNMQCHCGKHYQARKADLLRGWGLSCSKHCAAIRREYGRPAAKILGE